MHDYQTEKRNRDGVERAWEPQLALIVKSLCERQKLMRQLLSDK